MAEAPPDWLHGDRLHRVWGIVGDALERRALEARGTVELRGLTRDERHALSDVVGGPITDGDVRLRLVDLDGRIQPRTGRDLAGVVTWLTGRVLVDRADRRRAAAARREEPFEAAREWLRSMVPLAPMGGLGWPAWVDDWLNGLRRDGILTTVPDGEAVLVTALEMLDDRGAFAGAGVVGHDGASEDFRLVAPTGRAPGVVSRTDLAARRTGSAHGLDDGTKLALVVLRAAAAKAGARLARSAAERRQLWESLGVVVDRVSTTCLTWNLQQVPDRAQDAREPGLRRAADGAPRHVTWWDLDAGLDWASGQRVLVCENPRTLEAIAESGASSSGLGVVCTMGRANLVAAEVLGRLVSSGAVLRYHGDFDWPGVALANACLKDFGAQPWLMSVDDYLAGHGTHALAGSSIETEWDPELGPAMRSRGVAVHEEAVLGQVLERLPEIMG
jgi:hypothetical protein